MRLAFLLLSSAALLSAQSHPSWWNHASPEATALVGIEWQSIQNTPIVEPLASELWGNMGFPDLPCLRHARQILISSPELLALASVNCPSLASEARGFRAMKYRGIEMYFAHGKDALSIAQWNEQLVMLGAPETLQVAVDRTLDNSKDYSPLLARAAQFNGKDFWIVSSQLPDDLASRFLPLSVDAQRFEGAVSFRKGLELRATFTASSEKEADRTAETMQKDLQDVPAILRGLQVAVQADAVVMSLDASEEQVVASIRGLERAPEPAPAAVATVKLETPRAVAMVPVEQPAAAPAKAVEIPKENPVEKPVEKEKPQVVRIIGLDDGPKEFVLPPVKPDRQNPL